MSSDWLIPILIGASLAAAAPARAQEPAAPAPPAAPAAPAGPIVSSDIALSSDAAELTLELRGGASISLRLAEDGAVRLNGERIGAYERRDALDRSWRELLQRAMDAPAGTLPRLLVDWTPPADAGGIAGRLDRELEAAVQVSGAVAPAAPGAGAPNLGNASDSIERLNDRIRQLERLIEDPDVDVDLDGDLAGLRDLREDLERQIRAEIQEEIRTEVRSRVRDWNDGWNNPLRYIGRGLSGVFSTLMVYGILVGLGFLAVFFGRKYLEGIADTARHATLRSGLVGLAGSFLVLPAYILGLLALAISIVGIPLLLVFAPLFPVAVVLGAVGGYLAVAHGAGEALAERRFTGTEWFTRANSYYYVMTGVGLLLVLYLAASIVSMAGPWLGFLEGLLKFLAIMLTWAAFSIGFGALLISRGGTRPVRRDGAPADVDAGLAEETHV